MFEAVDVYEFLSVVQAPLAAGDAAQLAQAVQARWRVKDICPLLEHAQVDVRRVAAVVLGLIGDRKIVSCLVKSLSDADDQVNEMAEHSLWAIWFRGGDVRAAGPFREGVALLSTEAYEQAIGCFRKATTIDPAFAEAYNQCAIAHFFVGDYRRSIEQCRRAVALVPVHFGAIAGLGHCFTHLGELSQAIEYYRRALRINPRLQTIQRMIERIESRDKARNDSSGEFMFSEHPV